MQKEEVKKGEDLDYGRRHDLTVDEVRECEWFAHFSDKEAQEVVDTFKRFTEIVYHYYRSRQDAGEGQ